MPSTTCNAHIARSFHVTSSVPFTIRTNSSFVPFSSFPAAARSCSTRRACRTNQSFGWICSFTNSASGSFATSPVQRFGVPWTTR